MAGYIVAPGSVIHHVDGVLREGAAVPAALLRAWGEAGLKANLDAGSVVAVPDAEPAPSRPRRSGTAE